MKSYSTLLILFFKNFEGLNKMTFLSEIIACFFVLGFLPNLDFLCLKINVPKFEIFTLPFSFKLI